MRLNETTFPGVLSVPAVTNSSRRTVGADRSEERAKNDTEALRVPEAAGPTSSIDFCIEVH